MSLERCPCSGKNLDRFLQPAALAILAGGPIHGYRIVQSLAAMPTFAGHRPDAAGVYRFLKAMEERGLVSSVWDLSEDGPAKRLFDLTPKGTDCLNRWVTTLEEYRRQIGQLILSLRRPHSTPGVGIVQKTCACGTRRAARKAMPIAKPRRAAHPR
jgi:PadR family transcriptional regulator, regulatory protein PadR